MNYTVKYIMNGYSYSEDCSDFDELLTLLRTLRSNENIEHDKIVIINHEMSLEQFKQMFG